MFHDSFDGDQGFHALLPVFLADNVPQAFFTVDEIHEMGSTTSERLCKSLGQPEFELRIVPSEAENVLIGRQRWIGCRFNETIFFSRILYLCRQLEGG